MSQLLDDQDELLATQSRELTLSTGSILSLFVGLALLCGLFFGFGYNVGRRSGASAVLAATAEPAVPASSSTPSSESFSNFKPSAATPAKTSPSPSAARPDEFEPTTASTTSAEAPAKTSVPAHAAPALKTGSGSSPPHLSATASVPAASETAATTGPAGTFFVQVAAVSHPEDASLLMGALRSRGYAVAQRSEPADKLIHIQVGPFGSKPAAEAMRQRLQTDGYNAIIK